MAGAKEGSKPRDETVRDVARNRRATYDYAIEDRWEAGIVLLGSEVKSLRAGKAEIVDAWAGAENGEIHLHQLLIPVLGTTTVFPHETRRKRKLLLNKSEVKKIVDALKDKGYTLVPLRIYFKGRHAKVEIALARGKTKGDRRQAIAKKDAERETRVALGRLRKGG